MAGIQAGRPLAQMRPGSPTPRANVRSRLACANASTLDGRCVPDLDTPQHVGSAIQHPKSSHIPHQGFTNGPQDSRAGLTEIGTLGQEPSHRVLRDQPAIGLPTLGKQAAKSRFGFRQLVAQVGFPGEFGLRLKLRHAPRQALKSSNFLFRVQPIL